MPDYRIYFTDGGANIMARDEFRCDNDTIALDVAARLSEACSDVHSGYELWRGRFRVSPPHPEFRTWRTEDEINAQVEEIVAAREQALLDSSWTIANSQKLLEAAKGLMADMAKAKTKPAG